MGAAYTPGRLAVIPAAGVTPFKISRSILLPIGGADAPGIARKGGMQLGRSRAEAFDIESDVDLARLLERTLRRSRRL